jgi:hypothetical protein
MSRPASRQTKGSLAGWVALRTGLLIGLMVLGHKPGVAPAWSSLARPLSSESSRPLESESPAESPESEVAGEFLFHGQRSERSLTGERASCKLPPNHLTSHFSRGRGFLMAESCYGSEHDLRNGAGAHLRC